MEENEENIVKTEEEELPLDEDDDEFEESFDDVEDDTGEEEEFEDTEALEDELFKENPLKAIWIKIGEIKELLENA